MLAIIIYYNYSAKYTETLQYYYTGMLICMTSISMVPRLSQNRQTWACFVFGHLMLLMLQSAEYIVILETRVELNVHLILIYCVT